MKSLFPNKVMVIGTGGQDFTVFGGDRGGAGNTIQPVATNDSEHLHPPRHHLEEIRRLLHCQCFSVPNVSTKFKTVPCKRSLFSPWTLTKVHTGARKCYPSSGADSPGPGPLEGHCPPQTEEDRQDAWTEWCLALILEGGQDFGD